MDLTSVLTYKSLFFCTRSKGTSEQLKAGQKYTALANGTRCAITASQAVVPLYAVTKRLAETATNPTISNFAGNIANSRLKDIASAVSSGTTTEALKGISSTVSFLSKLGIAGNIAYATAKCMDAEEKDKTTTFMKASGNCAGMYLFEHLYSKVIDKINPDDINKHAGEINSVLQKIPMLKSVKVSSVLFAVGFVMASLYGCKIGELFGESLCKQEQRV